MVTRRGFLTASAAAIAGPVFAQAPSRSSLPAPRPSGLAARAAPDLGDVIAQAGLGGRVGCAVADARTGEILELHNALTGLPPASVSKAITCAYGLERLGGDFRFTTSVLADGPVVNGRLEGDLWLVGGGDPHMDTDQLEALAQQLQRAGLREVTGQLRLATGVLPQIREIDPDQPPHVGYNPSIGALNLNFNRVYFEWQRSGAGYQVSMDARSETIRPAVTRQRMEIVERAAPVYAYREAEGREMWSVAREALGDAGSRWLPVRDPALYVAEVFQVICASFGLVLRGPSLARMGGAPGQGAAVLAQHQSIPLTDLARSMMRFSTNLTAECIGLMASRAGGGDPQSLSGSGRQMAQWMRDGLGAVNPRFVDHSGLGEESRLRARDMVAALLASGADGPLRGLMRPVSMRDSNGRPIENHSARAVGKTGTLNFVSSLAGFASTRSGRDLAFAIFCADLPRRNALPDPQMERPEGGRAYNRAAKRLQQTLIERWSAIYE